MKRTICLILVLALLVPAVMLLASCNTKDNVLRVGMECNYAPFNWTQTNANDFTAPITTGGYADGYDAQIAKRIAESLGMELQIVKIEWDGLVPALVTGEIDMIIAGMSPTADRDLTIDFSEPYYESELVVVVKKDGSYAAATRLPDFTGARIVGQLNTFHATVISQIPGVNEMTPMETFPAMIAALQSGTIDGYVSELPGAVSAVASNPDLTYVKFAADGGFTASKEDVAVAVGVTEGNKELADSINAVLATITQAERSALMEAVIARQPASAD